MKTVKIKIDDSIVEEVYDFLNHLPKEKIRIIDNDNISYIEDDEQKELEKILKDKDCHIPLKTKIINI